jgi:hypothetical protein
LFDFEVKHVKGTKHTAADGLSRRPWQEGDTEDDEDIDEWLAMELNAVGIVPVGRKIRTKEVVPVQSRDIILRNQTPKTFTGHLDSGIQLLEINNQSLTASGSESATSKNDKIRKSHGKGRGLLHVTAGKTVNDNTNSHASLNNPTVLLDPLNNSYSEQY